ncbi:MAG: hypothetical protein JXM79_10420 [Sedimentisphaerales bacterium]|nr:hypothetical protein [Sedimentisphaerales bacterium]
MKDAASPPKEPKTISGILLSALDMEDEIAHSIYRDYLDRTNWPVEITDEVFEEIRKNLTILLDDTRRHRKMIRALQAKLDPQYGYCDETKTYR